MEKKTFSCQCAKSEMGVCGYQVKDEVDVTCGHHICPEVVAVEASEAVADPHGCLAVWLVCRRA